MATPRYTEAELWERVRSVWRKGSSYFSLMQKRKYVMVSLDETRKRCTFEYESGRQKSIPLTELYALYRELYEIGELLRSYLRDPENSVRVLGRKTWHAPGAAMYALLPLLDDGIKVSEGGHLFVEG